MIRFAGVPNCRETANNDRRAPLDNLRFPPLIDLQIRMASTIEDRQGGMLRARKRFGQHFLKDPAVIERIIDEIDPRAGEHIVEIGPGRGALTRPLLASGCTLHAIEIDRDLAAALQRRLGEAIEAPDPSGKKGCAPVDGRFFLHLADALEFDFTALAPPPLRIVGNLPYNISTPILFKLLASLPSIEDMHLMLQKEVVERLTALPGSKAWGRLGLMLQIDCEPESLFTVESDAFTPAPKVESSVVRLTPHPRPRLDPETKECLEAIAKACFSKRRKMLRNALGGICDAQTIRNAGIDPKARPEMLSVDDFAALARVVFDTNPGL